MNTKRERMEKIYLEKIAMMRGRAADQAAKAREREAATQLTKEKTNARRVAKKIVTKFMPRVARMQVTL